jgi:hypothetical protein
MKNNVNREVRKMNTRKHKLTEEQGDLLLSKAQRKEASITDVMNSLRWAIRKI